MHNDAERALARVGERLLDRREALLHVVTQQIIADIPAYQHLVPYDDLVESGRNVVGIVLNALITTGDHGATARHAATPEMNAGRRRFRQGVALEDVLRAIRLDFGVLWEAFTEEAKAEPDPTATVSLGALRIWAALDAEMVQITEGYRREEAAQDRERAMRRHRAMAELLDERDPSTQVLARIAEALEFDPDARFLVAVGRLSEDAARRLDTWWRSFRAPTYVGTHGTDVVAVTEWSAAARQVVTQFGDEQLVILVPELHGLQSVPAGIRLARVALRGTPKERTGALQPQDLLIEALTAQAADVAVPLATRILAPLSDLPPGEQARLLETLHAWSETDGTTSAVAQRLYRHRNTVTNHLRRIQELTGLSLTRPRDAATLVLALRAAEPMSRSAS
jgi:hypothetical protein